MSSPVITTGQEVKGGLPNGTQTAKEKASKYEVISRPEMTRVRCHFRKGALWFLQGSLLIDRLP